MRGNEVGQSCLYHGNQKVKKKGRAKTQLSLAQGYCRSHSEMRMRKSFCVFTCLSLSSHTWPLNPIAIGVLIANNRHKGRTTQRWPRGNPCAGVSLAAPRKKHNPGGLQKALLCVSCCSLLSLCFSLLLCHGHQELH